MISNEWLKASFCNGGDNCVEVFWQKSTFSGKSACVETMKDRGMVMVRDSKMEKSPILEFTPAEWAAFIQGVKAGEFDL